MDDSSDDSLGPGPEPPEGLRHGVPVEGLHHLHDLWDQVRNFVVKLYTDPKYRDATHKIVQRSTGRRSGRPDLRLSHVRVRDREILIEPVHRHLTCLRHELPCFIPFS
jgi:hypothetical protein